MDKILFTPCHLTDNDFDGVYNGYSGSYCVRKIIGQAYTPSQIEAIKQQAIWGYIDKKRKQGFHFIKASKFTKSKTNEYDR